MAMELDITPGAYAKIERDETDPSASRLLRIAEILEVDVIAFFRDSAGLPGDTESLHKTISSLKDDMELLKLNIRQLYKETEQLRRDIAAKKTSRK